VISYLELRTVDKVLKPVILRILPQLKKLKDEPLKRDEKEKFLRKGRPFNKYSINLSIT
jgi:hypothetical protein